MGKKFSGKTCIYCLTNPSTPTGDHIFAREFFLVNRRNNLPKVPACKPCNDTKSRLEHYLTSILPFGGRHEDAATNLKSMVSSRLTKNVKLHRELASSVQEVWTENDHGIYVKTISIKIDGEQLHELFTFIVRGLMWYHWQVLLPEQYDVKVISLAKSGESFFDQLLNMNSGKRINTEVGNGTFSYHGSQGVDYPEFSVWRFSVYGATKLSRDPKEIHGESTHIGAVTAIRNFFERPTSKKIFG